MVRGVRTRNALHFACLSRTLADADLLDWVGRLLRWGHVIVAIAWLGTSFHFFLLDNSLMRLGVGVGWAWTGPWVGLRRWHKARLRRGSHAQGLDRGGPSIAEARDALAARRVVQSGMLRQIEGRPLQSVLRRLRQHMLDEQRAGRHRPHHARIVGWLDAGDRAGDRADDCAGAERLMLQHIGTIEAALGKSLVEQPGAQARLRATLAPAPKPAPASSRALARRAPPTLLGAALPPVTGQHLLQVVDEAGHLLRHQLG